MKKIIYTIFVFFLVCNFGFSQEETLVGDVTNATMENNCEDGSIDLTINGGFPPYDVIWDFQPADSELPLVNDYSTASEIMGNNDGEDIESPAEEGTYTVFVTDALCGTATASFTIECECPECELTGSVTNEKCSSENGAIAVGISCEGEEANNQYTYQWSDLDPGVSQSASRADLSEGEYCVTVTDEENCEYSNCWTVENEIIPTPRATLVSQENITFCIEGETPSCTGALSIDVPEGSEVEWLNIPNQNEVNSLSVSDLCVGVYQVEVLRDGCGFTWSFEIECCITEGQDSGEYLEPLVVELVKKISPLTLTSYDGSITMNIEGGSEEYVISWTGPDSYSSTNESISGLGPGEYCLTVDDGCSTKTVCYILVDCSKNNIEIISSVTNTCSGVSFGLVELSVIGGVHPLDVNWSNGESSLSITELSEGTYCVTITDDSGCEGFSVTECFNVGLNQHEFAYNTSNPCGSQFTCNGRPSYFDPYDGPLSCQYEECTEWTCRCPLPGTGDVVTTRDDGHTAFRINTNDCTMDGRCREFPFDWEIVSVGIVDIFYDLVPIPGCNCAYCIELSRCTVDNREFWTYLRVDPSFCGVGLEGDPYGYDLKINELEFALREINIMEDSSILMIPVSFDANMEIVEYNRQVNELMENQDYINIRPLSTDEIIVDVDCETRSCGSNSGEGLIANVERRSQNNNVIQTKNSLNIKIQPNPVNDVLSILYNNEFKNGTYTLYNLLQQPILHDDLVRGQNIQRIETSLLIDGVYILVIKDGKEIIYTEKVIKN